MAEYDILADGQPIARRIAASWPAHALDAYLSRYSDWERPRRTSETSAVSDGGHVLTVRLTPLLSKPGPRPGGRSLAAQAAIRSRR